MNLIEIDGSQITTLKDLYRSLEKSFDCPIGYISNGIALRDVLEFDIPKPITVIWRDYDLSRDRIGHSNFDNIIKLFTSVSENAAVYFNGDPTINLELIQSQD